MERLIKRENLEIFLILFNERPFNPEVFFKYITNNLRKYAANLETDKSVLPSCT